LYTEVLLTILRIRVFLVMLGTEAKALHMPSLAYVLPLGYVPALLTVILTLKREEKGTLTREKERIP
jgi:hypothetical protein